MGESDIIVLALFRKAVGIRQICVCSAKNTIDKTSWCLLSRLRLDGKVGKILHLMIKAIGISAIWNRECHVILGEWLLYHTLWYSTNTTYTQLPKKKSIPCLVIENRNSLTISVAKKLVHSFHAPLLPLLIRFKTVNSSQLKRPFCGRRKSKNTRKNQSECEIKWNFL